MSHPAMGFPETCHDAVFVLPTPFHRVDAGGMQSSLA